MIKKIVPVIVTAAALCIVMTTGVINKNNTGNEKSTAGFNSVSETKASSDKTNEPMKGVWVTYMELSMQYDDDKSEGAFKRKFENIAQDCKSRGFNTLIVQVRPFCDALYSSDIFPYSHIITGIQGEAPGYDPLKIMCESCKKLGLKIHAWINPYRIKLNGIPRELCQTNPYKTDSELCIETDSTIILNPASKKARELIVGGVNELAKKYEIDGIQFDDYFYPTDIENEDNAQYLEYASTVENGFGMSLDEWRTANVNLLISEVYRTVHSSGREIEFGISPQGNLSNNAKLNADVVSWCCQFGYIDYICPQIYFSLENPALSFENALKEWTELDFHDNLKLYIGLAGYKAGSDADEKTWLGSDDILAQEYDISVDYKADGIMLYSYSSLVDINAEGEINNLCKLL